MRYLILCSNREEVFEELSTLDKITQKRRSKDNAEIYFNENIITILLKPFSYIMCGSKFDVVFLEKDYIDNETLLKIIMPSTKKLETLGTVKDLKIRIKEIEYNQKLLKLIDTKNWKEFDISELVYEYGIYTEHGEPRRWSRTTLTISQIEDRFFLTQWECGLTELQNNTFYKEPEEVFPKEELILVPEHYETKKWWETKDLKKFTVEDNK